MPPPADPVEDADELGRLRRALDEIDDVLHDALLRRAEIVERVAAIKGGIALRPGREAVILRRLLERHRGGLPRHTLYRIWRELFAGTTAMQQPFAIAVCEADHDDSHVALAREQFGALSILRRFARPTDALDEVAAGRAAAAVLPVPIEGEPPAAAWWIDLLQQPEPILHVVARLPFWSQRPEGSPRRPAMVVSRQPPDPSGDDRTLLGLELAPDTTRACIARDFAEAGLQHGPLILGREADGADHRVITDLAGFVEPADPRLAALNCLQRAPRVLGAYATPLA